MSKDVFEILSLLCEKIGPDVILDKVMSGMEGNKKPMQQKAVLQWILSVVEDFGVPNLNMKAIVSYLQKPTALQSSSPDVKKASIAVLSEMFHQVVDDSSLHRSSGTRFSLWWITSTFRAFS